MGVAYAWTRWPSSRVADVARTLLGWTVTANGVTVRLTETEAYAGVGEDPASHSHRGMTKRNAVMFGPAGFAYVYFNYGMHWMLNVTTGRVGEASAVLLRAGEIVAGTDLARQRRPAATDRDLARGPARLAQALGLDKSADGTPLLTGEGPIRMRPSARTIDEGQIRSGPRVGVNVGVDTPWRFWLDGEPTVSTFRAGTRRRRSPRVGR